jgi:hypothetical protein
MNRDSLSIGIMPLMGTKDHSSIFGKFLLVFFKCVIAYVWNIF